MPEKTLELNSITYTGPSMNPTLRAGDGLLIIPYAGSEVRRGDVIVFKSPEDDRKITHRVISVNPNGVRTRGDNNKNVDPWVLRPEHIIGRVVGAQRGKKPKKVFGGFAGELSLIAVRIRNALGSRITSLLRPPYRWMVRTGVLKRLLYPWIDTHLLSLSRSEGIELQLLIGRRVIGRLRPGKAQWQIRRPFRLFLDETSLPKGT